MSRDSLYETAGIRDREMQLENPSSVDHLQGKPSSILPFPNLLLSAYDDTKTASTAFLPPSTTTVYLLFGV